MQLYSGASENREVIAAVSIILKRSASLTSQLLLNLALYEADRKAHEEAVSNGGVRIVWNACLLAGAKSLS